MTHTRAWRAFRRTEDCAVAFSLLLFLAAVIHGWGALPGDPMLKLIFLIIAPSLFMALGGLAPLMIPPFRMALQTHVWRSFRSGFGQGAVSILVGLAILGGLAALIFWQTAQAVHGAKYPAEIFSAYAAGIGVLLAQATLVRVVERDPAIRPLIEEAA